MKACAKHAVEPVKGYNPCPGCEVEYLRREIETLRARLGEQPADERKDAERYRFISRNWRVQEAIDLVVGETLTVEEMDAAIDRALAEKGERNE